MINVILVMVIVLNPANIRCTVQRYMTWQCNVYRHCFKINFNCYSPLLSKETDIIRIENTKLFKIMT